MTLRTKSAFFFFCLFALMGLALGVAQVLWFHASLASALTIISTIVLLAFIAAYSCSGICLRQVAAVKVATQRMAAGDLSARVKVQASGEIGELAHDFNTMVDRLNDDRNQILAQKDQVAQVNRNYMEMLGFVTHELRTTVSSALFNADLLKEGSYGTLSADQAEGVSLIIDSLAYLEEITNSYLQLSRIEKGELVVNRVAVTVVPDVIAPVLAGFDPQMKAKEMVVENKIPAALIVPADVNLLRVVYENLIGNAIKYGKTGGKIVLEEKIAHGYASLSVFNEGKGLPESRLPTLFRKFQRYDTEEASGRRGTGLGLFLVQQIVSVHGGKIWAESEENVGTRFTFTLPT